MMISREEAIKELEFRRQITGGRFGEALDMAIEALSQPERPKGRWETVWHGEFIATLRCSVCGRRINVDYPLRERTIKSMYPYCHCGAEMRDVGYSETDKYYSICESLEKVGSADMRGGEE